MRLALRLLHLLFSAAPVALGITGFVYGLVWTEQRTQAEPRGPAVGEVVRFDPAPQAIELPGAGAEATRLAGQGLAAETLGGTCRLDATTLRRGGGSLVVVGREAGGATLDLRWAGGPTDAAADCGSAADLRVARDAFLILRNVATYGLPRLPQPMLH